MVMIYKQTINTSIQEIIKSLDGKKLAEHLREEAEKVSQFLDERIDANAPVRTGNLRENLSHSEPTLDNDTFHVEFGVRDSRLESLAIKLHEEPFQLGPKSRLEPPTYEGNVGSKFIARVFNANSEKILQRIIDSISEFLKRK